MVSTRLLPLLLAPALLSCLGARALAADEDPLAALGELRQPSLARGLVIGEAADGRPLHAVVLGRDPGQLEGRRGLLLVAGLDGRRGADSALLTEVLAALDAREDLAERLGDALLVVVPRANPAGLDAQPPHAGNGAPDDRDRDGRVDEDAPADLDGDGRVLWMRVPDGAGQWVVDEHDPRALRAPDAERGERATHRVLREGRDDDGDGAFHEDDRGGVEPDRNFPHDWAEHAPGTGRHPLEAPEAHALATLLLEHPGLLGVVVLGGSDTLVGKPKVDKNPPRRGGGYNERLAGLLEDDAAVLAHLGRRLDEAGEGEHAVEGDDLQPGSLLAWTYHEAGRWPLGVVAWAPPEEFPEEAAEETEKEGEEGEEGGDAGGSGAAGDERPASDARSDDDGPSGDVSAAGDTPTGVDARADAGAGGKGAAGDERPASDARSDDDGPSGDVSAAPDTPTGVDARGDVDAVGKGEEKGVDERGEPATDPNSPTPAALLANLDRADRPGAFTPWTAFEHPQLGAVELGGLDPSVPFSGPWEAEARAALAERLAAFALAVLDDFPALAVEDLEVQPRGDGAWRVSLALVNTGRLPTSSRFAADTRTARPLRVSLALPDGAARLAGPAERLVDHLDGLGGRAELHWVVAGAAPGERLLLRVDADTVPDLEQEIVLP